MHVLYEDDGDLKAGTVRSEAPASLQVDSTTGKRVKVKSGAVLLRFAQPGAEDLLGAAHAAAAQMDIEFLWQCAPQEEFGFEQLASDYCGREPSAVEAAAILLRLQSAPIYFQRKGRGRYRPASPEILRVALAGVERRRQQDEARAQMVRELVAGRLPAAIGAHGVELLVRPDRNAIEHKAVEQAAQETQTTPLRLLLRCGAIASPYAWHHDAFVARMFPEGVGFGPHLPSPDNPPAALAAAPVEAFSIDDSATTEIDDAFSVRAGPEAIVVGIHIAAPALAIPAGHALDRVARARMSTVYAPGLKFTMLPPAWGDAFSLVQGRSVPALSLYLELDPGTHEVRRARTALESVAVAANLRYDLLDDQVTEDLLDQAAVSTPFGAELAVLWRFANVLRAQRERVRGRPEPKGREEVSIRLDGDGADARVSLYKRRRDAPLDRIVAELMIYANSHWGAWLDSLGRVGIYRSQTLGRVRMSTSPAPHDGIGVAQYAWCTSPLRRYVDLLNQRQLIAAVGDAPAPHHRGDADLFAVVSGFDAAYTAYAEFQEQMERYWSLRWLQQEGIQRIEARVAKGEVVRLQGLPMTTRLAAAAGYERGQRLELEITQIDLVELSPNARLVRALAPDHEFDAVPEAVAEDAENGEES